MREWRKTHRLEGEALIRQRVRAYARVYLKRGKLKRQPCAVCGSPDSQMHHADYSKPLKVTWLCRLHHLALHGTEKQQEQARFSLWCAEKAKEIQG